MVMRINDREVGLDRRLVGSVTTPGQWRGGRNDEGVVGEHHGGKG